MDGLPRCAGPIVRCTVHDYGRTEWILEGKGFTGGLGAYWYPLRNSKDMRVHALFNYDGINRVMNMSAGITYALNLKLF